MGKCIVRLAKEKDAKAINDVSYYLGYSILSEGDYSKKLLALISSKEDKVYVAELSGKVVGWLHLFYTRRLASEDFYEIGGLVVNPDFRRQGIGKQLVEKVLNEHQNKIRVRCNEIRMESHKFYEQLGFTNNKTQYVFEKSA